MSTIKIMNLVSSRLSSLCKDRTISAMPFGGRYFIIYFVLRNFINSGFYKIKVLTQYRSEALLEHLSTYICFSTLVFVVLTPVSCILYSIKTTKSFKNRRCPKCSQLVYIKTKSISFFIPYVLKVKTPSRKGLC